MGRFQNKVWTARIIDDGEAALLFAPRSKIFLVARGNRKSAMFHYAYAPRGSHRICWKPFRQALVRNKELTYYNCFTFAHIYGVSFQLYASPFDIKSEEVQAIIRGLTWEPEER